MHNRESILIELKAISELVAGISPLTPYEVPAGYFQQFQHKLTQKLHEEISRSELSMPREIPYSIPDNYFESFSSDLMKRIRASASGSAKEELDILFPVLNEADKNSPFTAPAGYFEDLADNLVSGLKAIDFVNEELENNSSLTDLKNRPVYTVPTGYFQSFPDQILNRIKGKSIAKVVRLNTGKRIWQLAAAAVTVAMIFVAVFFISTKDDQSVPFAQVPSSDTSISSNIRKLSDEAIISYVENEDISVAESAILTTTSPANDEADFRLLLTDISDEALSQYVALHTDFKEVNTN